MITVTAAAAWCFMCCGITALFSALWWWAALDATRRAHGRTYAELRRERLAHSDTKAAHRACCADLRRNGINGAMRRHPSSHLRSVK